MPSLYRIAIVRNNGVLAQLVPGGQGERDMVAAITAAAVRRGVGMFRTEKAVRAAIEAACEEVLRALKSEVLPL